MIRCCLEFSPTTCKYLLVDFPWLWERTPNSNISSDENMKNPLVSPLPETDPSIEELVKFYNETLGFCPNSVRTMQIRPHLAEAFINLNKAVMENHGRVTSALKRLIAYVSSYTAGCQYCQAHTIRAAEPVSYTHLRAH